MQTITNKQLGESALKAYAERRLIFQSPKLENRVSCLYRSPAKHPAGPVGCGIGVALPEEVIEQIVACTDGYGHLGLNGCAVNHIENMGLVKFEDIEAAGAFQVAHDNVAKVDDDRRELRIEHELAFYNMARKLAGLRAVKELP